MNFSYKSLIEIFKENNVPEEETIEDFREAVALGLEILDEYYDKVTVTVSDSEGEDEDEPRFVRIIRVYLISI